MIGILNWGEQPLEVELMSCVSETVRVYSRVEVVITLYLTLFNWNTMALEPQFDPL